MNKAEKYFYNKEEFGWVEKFEKSWLPVREELLAIIEEPAENIPSKNWSAIYPDYVKNTSHLTAWKTFDFLFFGIRHPHNCRRCPKTFAFLQEIPGIIAAQYSVMEPQTHILPHRGYSRMILRCHLGLVIPEGPECGIRVGDTTKGWEEGKVLIFDDSYEHEAWNKSDKKRAVLMFDIANPAMNYTASQICRYKIENLNDSFLLSLADKQTWKKWFELGHFPEV